MPLLFMFLSFSEKHYLHYMFTVMIKADTLAVFSAVGESDDIQISHYSIEEQVWIRENLTEDDWNKAPEGPPESTDWYLDMIKILSNFTESSGEFKADSFLHYQTCCETLLDFLSTC